MGWRVHESESPELAAVLIQEAVVREEANTERLVLHSDYTDKKQMPKSVRMFCLSKEIALKTSA